MLFNCCFPSSYRPVMYIRFISFLSSSCITCYDNERLHTLFKKKRFVLRIHETKLKPYCFIYNVPLLNTNCVAPFLTFVTGAPPSGKVSSFSDDLIRNTQSILHSLSRVHRKNLISERKFLAFFYIILST